MTLLLFADARKYYKGNQICQIVVASFTELYHEFFIYFIPIIIITFTYFQLVRYVKEINKSIPSLNTLCCVYRESKLSSSMY